MTHWWRAYDGSIDHPKLLKLPSDAYRWAWFTLQCVASANGGVLPPTVDIAARLRMKPTKIADWIATLVKAGLIDNEDGVFRPHNWDTRQYKSDVTDPTAAQRMKSYRDRKRNERNAAVTVIRPETEQIQNTEQIDKIGDAGASSFTEGSKSLSTTFLKALGYLTPLSVPPEYAGTDWRAISWESAGWTADLIDTAARRIGAGKSVSYYEKVFATDFAKRQAPLPTVEIRPSEKVIVNGTAQKPGVVAVAKRWAEHFESQPGNGFEGDPVSVLRLSEG